MSTLLIRHGETALNVARVLQPADTPLSARGIVQAEALARRLASMNVVAILSSDLPRALRTAQAIAQATGLPIETSALLQERNFGDWRGRAHDEVGIDPLTTTQAPPGGESIATFDERVARAFALIVRRRAALPEGQLAVVSHGLVVRAMLAAHVRLADGLGAPHQMGNTSLSIVGAQPPHITTLVNCLQHLDGTAPDDANALSGG